MDAVFQGRGNVRRENSRARFKGQARRQEMKWGCFVKKVENWGCFSVKKWTFPQCRVHYVHYQYFLFYILLIWRGVRTHPTYPSCLWAWKASLHQRASQAPTKPFILYFSLMTDAYETTHCWSLFQLGPTFSHLCV